MIRLSHVCAINPTYKMFLQACPASGIVENYKQLRYSRSAEIQFILPGDGGRKMPGKLKPHFF